MERPPALTPLPQGERSKGSKKRGIRPLEKIKLKGGPMAEEFFHMETDAEPFPKADVLERFLATFMASLVRGPFFAFPPFIGPLAGIPYTLISAGNGKKP